MIMKQTGEKWFGLNMLNFKSSWILYQEYIFHMFDVVPGSRFAIEEKNFQF